MNTVSTLQWNTKTNDAVVPWEICIRIKRVSISNPHTLIGMGSCHKSRNAKGVGWILWQRPGWALLGSRTPNTTQGRSCHGNSTSHSALPEAVTRTQTNPTTPKCFPAVATDRNLSGSQWTAELYIWWAPQQSWGITQHTAGLNSPFNHGNSSIDLNYGEENAFDWLCAKRVSAPSIAKRHFWKLQTPNSVKASACPSNHCMYSVAASWASQNVLICPAQRSHRCSSGGLRRLCCYTHAGNALWKGSHLYKIAFQN